MNPQPTSSLNLTVVRKAKRIIVTLLGGSVLALGIALLVLPGPAFLVIPTGLAILAIEYAWAKRWLHKARAVWRRNGVPDEAKPGDLSAPKVRE